MKQIRGVNLGGWLVLERWISPSVFADTSATDEHSLCLELGAEAAKARLEAHRSTFITEAHIRQIAALGLDTVRLPVGYWLFGGHSPYIDGADTYVDKLFQWAQDHDIKVILDVHAAPGSQNGWDHSGKAGEIGWYHDQANVIGTLNFVTALSERYGNEKALIGIEPLNEPHWDVPLDILVDYYRKAGEIIRTYCHATVEVIVSDSFRGKDMSRALRRVGLDYVIDVHLYQLFTPEDRALDLNGHIKKVEKQWARELQEQTKHHTVIVGEWSAAMTELYDAVHGAQRHYTSEEYRTYFQSQRNLFESMQVGRTYWTARTEDGGVWSLLDHPEFL